jgi:hypothetical protein
MLVRNNFGHLYGSGMLPVLEELFMSELDMHPSRREELFKVISWDRDIYQSSEVHDMELFEQVSEGQEYSFKGVKQGAAKTLIVNKYGLGFSITEEMVDDGKFDLIADMVRKLSRSAKESQEIQAMNIFNNGFSSETTADGVALFSTAHTLPSGGTFRNKLSTDADLSPTSLDQALADFETQFRGDSGIIYRPKPEILLVHSNQRRYAKEILGSELKPDTADNNINALKDEGLRVVSSPHLTDEDAWYLIGRKEDTGLRIIQRKPIETMAGSPDLGFKNDSILYKSRYREVIGALHPNCVFGTSGA